LVGFVVNALGIWNYLGILLFTVLGNAVDAKVFSMKLMVHSFAVRK